MTAGSQRAPRCAKCLHALGRLPPRSTECPSHRAVASLVLLLPLLVLVLPPREQERAAAAETAQPRSAARAARCLRLLAAGQALAGRQQLRPAVQEAARQHSLFHRQACWMHPSLTDNEERKMMQTRHRAGKKKALSKTPVHAPQKTHTQKHENMLKHKETHAMRFVIKYHLIVSEEMKDGKEREINSCSGGFSVPSSRRPQASVPSLEVPHQTLLPPLHLPPPPLQIPRLHFHPQNHPHPHR